ncbi:hypothetical protein [Ramlibacter albus]|uniref:Uncharacterized protein n=1 Tax=Ramlibacter albus TaxID=2079448 RepID=A0A923MFQ1_9BURK|nr:hypothetical protein [Ramlibacter albus]MBC5768419.1 hypothetical protein [Ramlibacter albus]
MSDIRAFDQVVPPSVLTCTRLPLATVCVPLTISVVSEVMKSAMPVSVLIAPMTTFSLVPGGVMSIVTSWVSLRTVLPLSSTSRTV